MTTHCKDGTEKKCTFEGIPDLNRLTQLCLQSVTPGRAFLRRLLDITCYVSGPFGEIDFTSEELADIKA